MFNTVEDVLYFIDTGFIRTHYIATEFEGREPCISVDFMDELDVQLQLNETEADSDHFIAPCSD